MRFYNDGNTADTLRVTGRGGNSGWRVAYFDTTDSDAGVEITSSVTGTGWTTSPVAPDAYRRIRLEVTPLSGRPPGASLSVLVTAASMADWPRADAVKAVTTCVLTRRPDGLIHNGTTFVGDGIFNMDGAGQARSQIVPANSVAAYVARFYNDGNAADAIRVSGPGGNYAWRLKYIDYSTGAEITAAVTGAGWTTPSLAAGGYRAVRVEVTPLSRAAGNSVCDVLLKGTSSGDSNKRDVVKASTTCGPSYQPDGLVYNGASYIGDNVYNSTGSGQTHAQSVGLGATATYQVYLSNDGNVPQKLRVTGPAGDSEWTVRYLDYASGANLTAAVTGAGWLTPTLNPRATCRLRILVTPGSSASVGSTFSVLLAGRSIVDATKMDAVKATTSRR